jgi:hypothetical protein
MVALIFMSAFGTLALSFWPYMIPPVITVDQAAAPHSSLALMFWGRRGGRLSTHADLHDRQLLRLQGHGQDNGRISLKLGGHPAHGFGSQPDGLLVIGFGGPHARVLKARHQLLRANLCRGAVDMIIGVQHVIRRKV